MNLLCFLAPQQPQKSISASIVWLVAALRFLYSLYVQTDTDLRALGYFFFSHEYVLITRSLVLLKIVMTFVSRVFLLLEKALAKASLKCISGCDEQDVRSALLAWCAGALRQEKETITSCCQNNSFCVFFSESIRAKSPTHWSQGKDSCCFAQLWIKATVQRHDFSVG